MLKIFLILILMMMLVWILFQYWNQLVCNTLFTSKIIRKCFLKLVHLVLLSSVLMLKTIFIFLTLFTIFRTKDESFIFNLFQLVSIHCDWYYSICTVGKLFFSLSIRKSISRNIYLNHLLYLRLSLPNVHCFSVKNQKYKK